MGSIVVHTQEFSLCGCDTSVASLDDAFLKETIMANARYKGVEAVVCGELNEMV